MNSDFLVVATILGMALVTYLTRISGFFIAERIKNMPKAVEKGMRYIPGTIIVSIIAPQIIEGGVSTAVASLISLISALIFRNLIVVMTIGVLTVYLLRNYFMV